MRKSVLFLMLAACGPSGDPEAGSVAYGVNCALCHGVGGDEQIAHETANDTPAAKLSEEVPEKSDAELREIIVNGEGDMPPAELSDEDVDNIIAYLRETF